MDKNKNLSKKRARVHSDDEDLSDSSEDLKYTSKKNTKDDKNSNKKKQDDSDTEDNDVIVGKDEITFILNTKKRLNVRKFKGQILVDIREYWTDDSKVTRPTKKGVALTLENWNKVKNMTDRIDEAIKNMK